MSSLIDKRLFKTVFFWLILAEILSFFGWLLPQFNTVVFFVIIFLTLILSLQKLEYGLYILLAELFVGSKGYLFSLEFGETLVSIRMGLFLVVMGVWFLKFILRRSDDSRTDEGSPGSSGVITNRIKSVIYGIPRFARNKLVAFAVVILWAFVWGLIRGNNFGNVFLDFNNWLYFLLVLPMCYVMSCRDAIYGVSKEGDAINRVSTEKNNFFQSILTILFVSVFWLGIKSLFLLYIFSHQFTWALPEVYQWVRDTGVGEITWTGNGFWRVFMQSQIYTLLLFFILLLNPKSEIRNPKQIQNSKFKIQNKLKTKNYKLQIINYGLLIVCFATVILSFSRSFWLALIITLLLYYFITLLLKHKFLDIFKSFAKILLVAGLSFGLLFLVLKLPPKTDGADLTSMLGRRASEMEAAGTSRLNQLKPLMLAIAKHPLIGSGFGTTITYKTNDPRIVPETAGQTGEFTTYAFEWGYLDMILKFGLIGLAVYLIIIFGLLKRLLNFQFPIPNFQINSNNQSPKITNYGPVPTFRPRAQGRVDGAEGLQITDYGLRLGFGLALVSLLIVNIFSPYLNHPLGIGFIIISHIVILNERNE